MSKLRDDIDCDQFNREATDCLPGLLGVEIIGVAQGEVSARMQIGKRHMAPNDYLHAASIIALADTACGFATLAHLPDGATSFTTVELKSNHLGTLRDGALSCSASAQHLGRSTQVWDAIVSDESSGRKLALFRCTQMLLWPK